ncbi:mRNA capping enzyme, catalytic domain-containing protein [Xylariales sp. AK1849]|nr:mRNA capping enzyme, catalytic domain-containing protein [Xylariales sp. AK1849]
MQAQIRTTTPLMMEGPIKAIDQPGIKAQGDLLHNLQREVATLLGRDQASFPGAQPVSFTRSHLVSELPRQDYYVCEKSDGVRYLLYLTDDGNGGEAHYLIDRKNDYWWVKGVHFPTLQGETMFHKDTLLDGELVMDTLPDGRQEPVYLVFDCLVMAGQKLVTRPLQKRLGYFQLNVMAPYKKLFEKYPAERAFQPLILSFKDMQSAYHVDMIFGHVIPNLKHGNDGLIFTCTKTPYKHGTDVHILKWKPADENSVDFQWKLHFRLIDPDEADRADGITEPYVDYDSVPKVELLMYYGGNDPYKHFGEMWLSDDEWEELKALDEPLDERVVEAWMDDQQRWRFYRFRDDKHHGNHHSVVTSVLESIQDRVTKEDLVGAANGIRDNWKRREQQERQQAE